MEKSNIIKLTMLMITITIIYTLMVYYGIGRYLETHFRSFNHYTDKYRNKTHTPNDSKIIVAFYTSDPGRTKPTINSILDQTVKVDEIRMVISHELTDKVPDEIKNNIYIQSEYVDRGDRNLNALIPVVLSIENTKDILVVIKDDSVYGVDFIEMLMEKHLKNPNNIISVPMESVLLKPNFIKAESCVKTMDELLTTYNNADLVFMKYDEIYRRVPF